VTDLTTLSNEQLLELARSRNQPPQPAAPSLADMSDEQLLRLAARRDMTQGRALVQGLTSGAMLNLNDETAGLRAAGLAGLPEGAQRAIARVPVASALAANIGGARMAAERLFPQTFGSRATEAYAPARDIERAQDKAAEEQFPATYTGANIAGSVAVPAGSLARGLKAATAFGAGTGAISGFGRGEGLEDRLQGAAIEGGIGAVAPAAFTGAFRAAGSGLGRAGLGATVGGVAGATQGNNLEERATNAALGAGIGAIAPAALLMAGRPVVNTIYGAVAPGNLAERQVRQAILADRARGVQDVLSPEDIAAARAAGQDIVVGDLGATATTRLGRAATNVSPDAEAALRGATTGRYEEQRNRFGEFINGLFDGNLNMTAVNDSLETAARLANRPRYDAAYRAGENAELWTPELQRIATSPDVQAAIRAVERKAANRAVTEGAQVVRNPFRFDDQGNMTWATTPDGGQIQPNLQFWDHVQRNLRGMAQAAPRGSDDARELEDLRRLLNKELDAAVPEFGQARGMARQFFGAEDAGEAGQLFLRKRQGIQLTDAQKAFQGMSEPEREMFRRGFASELAHTLRTATAGRDVVKMFDGVDRKKLELVFPPDELRQLEGFARREQIMNRLYTAVTSGSTTARQARDIGLGVVGGGAAGAFSAGDPVTGLALGGSLGALVVGLLSRGRASVSEKVMREIGEIMSSNDPARINALLAGPTGPEILKGLRTASTAVDNMPKPPRIEPTIGTPPSTPSLPPPGPPGPTGFAKGGQVKEPKMSPIIEAIIEEMGKRMAPEGARRAAAIGGYSRGGAVMKVARAIADRLVPEGGEATRGGLAAARETAEAAAPLTRRGSDLIARDPQLTGDKLELSERGDLLPNVEYRYTRKDDLAPWRELTPEDLYRERAYIAPALGDRSPGNMIIDEINGVRLARPVDTQGGGDFQRANLDAAWANREAAAKGLMGKIAAQTADDSPVYMAHTLMGLDSVDSSHMMVQAILRQIAENKGNIDRAAAEKVDEFISKKIKGWPGILNTEAAERFLAREKSPGKDSSIVVKALDKAGPRKGGFPDVGAARFAVTDPRLLSADQLASGYTFSRLNPRGALFRSERPHETYPVNLPSAGEGYAGGFRNQVPAEVMFSDWARGMKPVDRNNNPLTPTMKQQALMTQVPVQRANQEWLDTVMSYIEANPRKWGYRKGGLAKSRAASR
jgi:hypothetical protein